MRFASANFRATRTTVTLHHLTLQKGKAAGTPIPSAPAPCSQGFQGDGGALFRTPDANRARIVFDRCSFDGNSAASGGGALYLHHSDVTASASSFANNRAPSAGALQADDVTLDFTNVTFAGNAATHGTGGALSIFGNGGTLTNVTFANNQALGGSGFFAAAIFGSTSFTVRNSLFWNDTSDDGGAPMQCQTPSTGGGDLQWPMTHLAGGAPDGPCVTGVSFADARLQPLGDNGGATPTMALGAGSPAIGAGSGLSADRSTGSRARWGALRRRRLRTVALRGEGGEGAGCY